MFVLVFGVLVGVPFLSFGFRVAFVAIIALAEFQAPFAELVCGSLALLSN